MEIRLGYSKRENSFYLFNRTISLYIKHKDYLFQLFSDLLQKELTPLAREFIIALAEIIHINDLVNLSKEMMFIILNINHCHTTNPLLWKQTSQTQIEIWDMITSNNKELSDSTIKLIIHAILEAEVDIIAKDVISLWGNKAIKAILDWYNNSTITTPTVFSSKWQSCMKKEPSFLLQYLENNQNNLRNSTIVLITRLIDPYSSILHKYGLKIWVNLLNKDFSDLIKRDYKYINAFLLTLGFEDTGKESIKLVYYSFKVIHEALQYDSLHYESWNLIKHHLPYLFFWQNWDKCLRLRMALEKFKKNH